MTAAIGAVPQGSSAFATTPVVATDDTATEVPLAYFGKCPARGDFVRSSGQPALTQALDRWASEAVELLAQDVHWKPLYDRAPPLHFAFLGAQQHAVMAGHLRPSQDASGRRFPLITAASFEVAVPAEFLPRSPLALERLWGPLERAAHGLQQAADAAPLLQQLAQDRLSVQTRAAPLEPTWQAFAERHTVASLQAALRAAHPGFDFKRAVLGLGLLLQPVPTSGAQQLDKGLALPLPAEPALRPLVAAFWLDLVHRFLRRGTFEIGLFVSTPRPDEAVSNAPPRSGPLLHIGFQGGAPQGLHALLDPRLTPQAYLPLLAPDWVDAALAGDVGERKLAAYLDQPQLSLAQLARTFGECFLGE